MKYPPETCSPLSLDLCLCPQSLYLYPLFFILSPVILEQCLPLYTPPPLSGSGYTEYPHSALLPFFPFENHRESIPATLAPRSPPT